jgi:hypothetical protein
MPKFIVDIARAMVAGAIVVGKAVGGFLYRMGHDWSLVWVPILAVAAVGLGLWALALRKD